jgi:hypothetical protein
MRKGQAPTSFPAPRTAVMAPTSQWRLPRPTFLAFFYSAWPFPSNLSPALWCSVPHQPFRNKLNLAMASSKIGRSAA